MKNLLAIENLKKELYTSINNSELTVAEVYYIVKDLYAEVVNAYNKALKEAYEEEEAEAETETVEEVEQ